MNPPQRSPAAPSTGGGHTPVTTLGTVLILSALMSFGSISTDIYLPALPTIARELHGQHGSVELTLSAFLVGFSLGQLVWGPISDRVGRRLPIALGLLLFMLGSVGCALAGSITQMLVWRAVQAAGACVGPVLARAMVRDLYGRERSAQMLSQLILIMGIAPLIGPMLGAQILEYASWRWIFWFLLLMGALMLAALRTLPETLSPAMRSQEPMRRVLAIYLDLIRDPRLLGYALVGGFFYGGVYAYIVATPFIYIDYYHVSPQAYGWLFGVNIVGLMAANWLNGRLMPRLGSHALYRAATCAMAVIGLLAGFTGAAGLGGLAGVALSCFLFVSMNGFIVANSVAGALAAFPHRAGAASSLVGAIHFGSGVLSAGLVGLTADGTPRPLAVILCCAGLGCFLVSQLVEHRLRRLASAA
ncbi:Bcr/CflA family efflux MFS transporter [Xylophilus rhododendri]|uniref:Bcr/CflA family efflux transporter n=1 Tax=Xylophilus rhododendri TaxID=2697032 RepID=A0A857J6T3_9BURK|nr:multidrug effflux MFS transporter [Xylophilus rhododendri]QHI98498.1 Bcr/CflA family efflux MFS transporter [Xylophilus rhododendri]